MGSLRRFLSLLFLCLCCAVAGLASAQSISITFLNDWGEQTPRILEEGRAFLRVIDPGADFSPEPDRISVDVSSLETQDALTTDLVETGPSTGVFEGGVSLTTDFYNDYVADSAYLVVSPGAYPPLDTVTATYGGVSEIAEAAPSRTDLLDDGDRSPASFALGERVRVRVQDIYFDRYTGQDRIPAVLNSSSGDSETLTLVETRDRNGVFEISIPLVAGTPVAQDGRLQTDVGESLSVVHADLNGVTGSIDSAYVEAASVRFIDRSEGRPTGLYVEDGEVVVRVVDLAANLDPGTFDSTAVTLSRSTDMETLTLRETGTDTGVFEGRMRLLAGLLSIGNGFLEHPNPPATDTVGVAYGSFSDTAQVVHSITRLLDEAGADAASVAPGQTLRIEVENAHFMSYGQLDSARVRIRSLTTGDEETLTLLETGSATWRLEGTLRPVLGWVGFPNDGLLQVQPGEVLKAEHLDQNGIPRSSDQVEVVRSAVRFVDESGRPVSVLLEQDTAHVEVLDLASPGQAPPPASIESRFGGDLEALVLAESATPGWFEGSMPLIESWSWPGDGLLRTRQESGAGEHPDRVTARSNGALAVAATVPLLLELLDEQGEPMATAAGGATVRVRARAPAMNLSPAEAETLVASVASLAGEDWDYLFLVETGPDTAVFEGSFTTLVTQDPNVPNTLTVRSSDTVTASYNTYPYGTADQVVASLSIVPVVLELLDGDGRGASTYLANETVHLRVSEPGANTDPTSEETVAVQVETWRPSDSGFDLETVDLTETGPDTGVFTGSLPAVTLSFYDTAMPGNGALEMPEIMPPFRDASTVTATRSGVSDRAVFADSELWLTDDQDQDATAFQIGSSIKVWLRRPRGNVGPAADSEEVAVRIRTAAGDQEWLELEETGVDTGLFTGLLPVEAAPATAYDDVLSGSPGNIVEVEKGSGYYVFAFDRGSLTAPPSRPPDAVDDSVTTDEDVLVTVPVRVNDTDPDGDTLTVIEVTQGTKGSTAHDGVAVAYTPHPDESGTDSFTYTISDGNGATDTATVTVSITPQNDPPVAVDDAASTPEDTAVMIPVLVNDMDNDSAPVSVSAVTQGTKGSVTHTDLTATYTPNANANGTDSFTYTVSDGYGGTDTGTVTVTITPQNDPPVAVDDSATTNEDTPVVIAVLANDSDVDSGALSVSAVTQGAQGAVSSNGTSVTYIPAANFNGADAFTYTVSDGQGGTATATVSVAVAAVNDAPAAAPDSGATREDVSIIIPVLANDTDLEGNALTVTSVSVPPNGLTSRLPDHTVFYKPHANFTGSETFSYTVSDGQGGTTTGQVTVLVGEALERVAVLATNSVALRTGSDVLSGDVIVNQASAGPFLNGAELSIGGSVTAASNYDLEGDSVTVASGAVIGSDVRFNQLTNSGTINGQQSSPLALPVFSTLPPFLTATPGSTTINVGTNGSQTVAAGSYLDLIVGRKGTVTFTGGTYHFRTIQVDREAKLYFTAASQIRVQQKLSTKNLTTIGPAAGAPIDASSIVFYVAGINGTTGTLAATPKAVEIGTNNLLNANLYAPNGTIWLQDSTQATGAFLGKDVDVAINVQVQLDSAFSGGQ